jgi:hypothetical protein
MESSPTLTPTTPVRTGAAVSGPTEQVSGVIYKMQPSSGLELWDKVVREVTGANKICIDSPMPDLNPDGG